MIGRAGLAMILAFGTYTGTASLWIFYHFLPLGDEAVARTAAFTAMVLFEKVSVFAFRSLPPQLHPDRLVVEPAAHRRPLRDDRRAARRGLLAAVAGCSCSTEALGWAQWQLIAPAALPLLVVPELIKALRPKRPRGAED